MKKKLSLFVMLGILAFALTGCDSPGEMMDIYKEKRIQTGNTLDALGRYFQVYGWYYLVWEDSAKDIVWEDAAKTNLVIQNMPKLADKIDTLEHTEGKSAIIHLKDDDYISSLGEYITLLTDYGYSYVEERKDKDEYRLKFYMKTDDEPISVIITAYEREYSATHNVKIYASISKYNTPF